MIRLFYLSRYWVQTLISACKPRNYRALWSVAILIAIFIANPVLAAAMDYGDAPTSLTAIDGDLTNTYISASHQIGNSTYLGATVDAESSNQPTINADGDDNNGTPNDEDGVTFPLTGSTRFLTSGESNTLTIRASKTGYLNAWIDWNQDGDWLDAGEQIATDLNLSSGGNSLNVNVPPTTPHGVTYTRFRFSSTSGIGPTGDTINDGEVEDYKVNITLPQKLSCTVGLLNGGFEQPDLPLSGNGTPPLLQNFGGGIVGSYKENDVPAWGTIPNDPGSNNGEFDLRNAIEFWKGSQTYIPSIKPFEGNQFVEINANVPGRLYQDFALPPGAEVRWQVAHRGRAGDDTMAVYLGTPDNEIQQGSTHTTPSTEWRVYSGVYTVPGGQDITRFALKSIISAGGSLGAGNFVDDVRLTARCPSLVKGYKSVKLTTDNNSNSIVNPGDTLTYSLYYTNTGTGPAAGFQINDLLPAGVTITAPGATTVTAIQNASATKNSSYTGAAGASNLFNPGALLDVGGIIRVDIPATVNADTISSTLINQGMASSNDFSGQIATDNIDSTTSGLGLNVPTGSIPQQQNSSIDPTSIRVVNVLTKANILFVKRITAVRDNSMKNPNDNTVLNTFVDDFTDNDNNPYWPGNYLIGATDAGKVKSGDSIEYTVYFLNAGLSGAKSVNLCDLITANQSFQTGAYGSMGKDIQIQIGTDPVQYLTATDDTLDRTQVYSPGATISNCNLKAANTNSSVVAVGVTGAANTGIPALTVIPGSTAAGTPNNSYGLVRFRTIVQ